MPEPHSSGEFATVDQAHKILDFPVPMLRRLAESGRVRWRVAPDGRPRLSMADLRVVANTLSLEEYRALAATGADAGPETPAWAREEELIAREWTGHTPEDIWAHERQLWATMGRAIRPTQVRGAMQGQAR